MEKTVEGFNGTLIIKDYEIILKRNKFISPMDKHGRKSGDRVIPISEITSIQLSKSPKILNRGGFIKFCFGGNSEIRGGFKEASKDDCAITFMPNKNEEFESVQSLIIKRKTEIANMKNNANSSNEVIADVPAQIEKLAKLKEQGILTEEEFNKKKAELLERI